MTRSWLRAERVLLPDGRVAPARVAIEGTRIVAVEEGSAAAPGDRDLGDRLLAPAFVDAHVHLALSALRGLSVDAASAGNVVEELFFPIERCMTAEDVRAFVRMGALEAMLAGTGFVWDHYYFGEAVAQGLADVGLAGVVAPTLQDRGGPGVARWASELENTATIAGSERFASRGIFAALGPHATDTVSDDLWRQILPAAEALGLPIHLHVAQSLEEVERAHERAGCSPVGLLERVGALMDHRVLVVHGLYVSRADLASLDPDRHLLVVCPSSQLIFGFVADVASWEGQGLRWTVGTDCASTNDALDVQKELRMVAGWRTVPVSAGVAADRFRATGSLEDARAVAVERRERWDRLHALGEPPGLLERVTTLPGRFHPRVDVGAIAPGHLANLQVLDPRHPALWPGDDLVRGLAMGGTSGAIERLMVAGRWIGGEAGLRSLLGSTLWTEAEAEATARRDALLKRAGLR